MAPVKPAPSPPLDDLKALLMEDPARTLAVAESLTSGRLQARIGAVSGASDYFLGGITAYSLDQKVRHLGVDRAGAAAVNSVSAAVAEQMARGACVLFGSDLGVATTGYAERSAEFGVAQPFAWWGLARRLPGGGYGVKSGRVDCPGLPRVEVQERVAAEALAALAAWIRGKAAARGS
jgi:nicotinamide-nucleotide amidase